MKDKQAGALDGRVADVTATFFSSDGGYFEALFNIAARGLLARFQHLLNSYF